MNTDIARMNNRLSRKASTRCFVGLVTCLAFLILAFGAMEARAEWPHVVLSKDNVPISYEVYGTGEPTLVFVHGWSCDARYWRDQVPYFSKNPSEFWQRWHITLSTWFRDYIYIPLGGNQVTRGRFAVNILAVFIFSGLWHGAAWTFIIWGGLHGVCYLLEKITSPLRASIREFLGIRGKIAAVMQVVITFNVVSLAWIFFRARSIEDAICLIEHMFINFSLPVRMMTSQFSTALTVCFALFFIILELLLYWDAKTDFRMSKAIPVAVKYPVYTIGLLTISLFGLSSNEFIYFHF